MAHRGSFRPEMEPRLIERLKDFEFSDAVQPIIRWRREMGGEPNGADAAITASLLFVAILRDKPERPTVGTFLRDLLYEGNSEEGEKTIKAYFPFYASRHWSQDRELTPG